MELSYGADAILGFDLVLLHFHFLTYFITHLLL